MKKKLSLLLALLLLYPCLSAPAEEDEDLLIEEIVENVDLDAVTYGEVEWTFPIPLEDMNPEYIRLANKHYLLADDYVPQDLVKVPSKPKNGGIYWAVQPKGGQLLREECAQALCDMNAAIREAAEENGYRSLYLKSAYRSYQTQRTMYRNRLERNNGKDDGWVSMPGASDHQTGLGCDVVPSNWRDKAMNDKMMKEPECQWMAEHCHEFGFIIRYPADKQELTEINTEPWHLRYVGIPVAAYIMENGLCLEEFTYELQDAIQDFLSRGGNPETVQPYIQEPAD
ncbi:MAG: M15 family metallopeptidase [Clostridia bacterium]|nr:M15 family metallopeptidase [Clostridia bacterium]